MAGGRQEREQKRVNMEIMRKRRRRRKIDGQRGCICGNAASAGGPAPRRRIWTSTRFFSSLLSLFFSFLSHKVVHNQMDRTVKCEQCSMIFFDQRDLRAHEKAAHKLDFHCVYCDKQFRMATYLEKHLEKHKLLMEK